MEIIKFRVFNILEPQEPGPSQETREEEKSSAIEQIVSEAVKRVLKENGQLLENFDASKIMELVGQQKLVEKVVEHLAPATSPKKLEGNSSHRSKSHKIYNIPVGTPAYTPTPIAVLKKGIPTPSKVENYEPTNSSAGRVAPYKPCKVSSSSKSEESYTPSSIGSSSTHQSRVDNYVPTNSSNTSTATYKPSKVVMKSEEGYTPSTLENTPDVNYTPSSRDSDNVISDRYTPPSSLNCDVDYQPTTREFSSVEPSYSPSCSTFESGMVDYSPSSISTLVAEPSYSPAPASSNVPMQVDYTPSSLAGGQQQQLTPEKYLELFETGEGDEPVETNEAASKKAKSEKDEERRKREKEKERERRRRKEKEREREKRKSGSSRSSDQDSQSKRSSNKHSSSSSSSKKSRSSESKSKSSESKSYKNETTEMESDSDVDEECYRIFKEYQPAETNGQADDHKKRKSEEVPPVSEVIIPVKKQRVAHTSTDAPPRPSSLVSQRPPQRLTPGMMMIDRFKKLQEAKAAAEAQSWPQPSSTPHRTATAPFPTSSGTEKKRIAHVPNVMGLLSGKPKATPAVSPALPTSSAAGQPQQSVQQQKTLGNSVVRRPAVPNKPANPPTKLPRPMIAIELGCRVPATIRQKYLNILVDETLKIYDREEDAYERAVEEEKQSYAKCSSKVVYVNVITNVVQRIRREAESTSNPTSSSRGDGKSMSHSAMLAGKGGATVSWSIEKSKTNKIDTNLLKGAALYKLMERHILTLEQQDFNGYPRPDPNERGRALVNQINKFRSKPNVNLAPDQRICDRCSTIYKVNNKGLAVKEDDTCSYHWGKPFQRRGETRYTCCKGEANSDGCSIAKWHVSDTGSLINLKGFVRTMAKTPPPDGNYGVYALDCEMCYTTEGPELTRVTVISNECKVIYETLVKPDNPILDYNTRFSGITEEDLQNVKTTIRDVQAVLLSKFSDKTILIGHSFDSDLRALRMIHDTVIDTSVVFPHSRGPPYKKALRTLCGDILQKIIQNDVGGHDSAEDAIACMELMMWKIKQDLKLLK
nr:EOG090X01LQ [Simocephalus serrulatus]